MHLPHIRADLACLAAWRIVWKPEGSNIGGALAFFRIKTRSEQAGLKQSISAEKLLREAATTALSCGAVTRKVVVGPPADA